MRHRTSVLYLARLLFQISQSIVTVIQRDPKKSLDCCKKCFQSSAHLFYWDQVFLYCDFETFFSLEEFLKNLQNAFLLGVLINNELDDNLIRNLMLFLIQALKNPDLHRRSKLDIKLNADFKKLDLKVPALDIFLDPKSTSFQGKLIVLKRVPDPILYLGILTCWFFKSFYLQNLSGFKRSAGGH